MANAKAVDGASRSAVRRGAFDGLGLELGATINGPSAAAAYGAFEGQSDGRGNSKGALMGALFFPPAAFREWFLTYSLQHVPASGGHGRYQVPANSQEGSK